MSNDVTKDKKMGKPASASTNQGSKHRVFWATLVFAATLSVSTPPDSDADPTFEQPAGEQASSIVSSEKESLQ